jgi:hypothetical protein
MEKIMANWLKRFSAWIQMDVLEKWVSSEAECETIYHGVFVIWIGEKRYAIPGRIVERPGAPAAVYLSHAPPALWTHPHGRCFQKVQPGSDWVKLHWREPAYDFVTARQYVTSLLTEALRSTSKARMYFV